MRFVKVSERGLGELEPNRRTISLPTTRSGRFQLVQPHSVAGFVLPQAEDSEPMAYWTRASANSVHRCTQKTLPLIDLIAERRRLERLTPEETVANLRQIEVTILLSLYRDRRVQLHLRSPTFNKPAGVGWSGRAKPKLKEISNPFAVSLSLRPKAIRPQHACGTCRHKVTPSTFHAPLSGPDAAIDSF